MNDWKLQPARDLGLSWHDRLGSLQRENGLFESAAHLGWWSLVRTYLRLAHRVRVEGRENLPAELPFVLVANHASHLDALVLGALLPWRLRDQVFPIAAGDTFFDNRLGRVFAAGMLNALPLWRRRCGPHALMQLRQRLVEQRCGYILFPEGTRSRDGAMGSFKPGIGMLVAGTSVPVIPCYLSGTHAVWPPIQRLPRPGVVSVRIGSPHAFAEVPNEQTGWKEIARTLEQAVRCCQPITA
ncbi:MAG: lysophospholipid acyltransferase family protein [Gemmataceae bacterium]